MRDIEFDINGDMRMFGPPHDRMFDPPHVPWKNMRRHTACVPKGFLRYYVLKLLKDNPMSGSEIMDAIDKETHGVWRPSPGSIYPLLAWLQDNGYIKEATKEESGVKRYIITERGLKLLEEQSKIREKMRRMFFFAPQFLWFTPPLERADEVHEALGRVIRASADLRFALGERLSEQVLKEVVEALNSAAEKIEALSKRIKEEK